MVERKIRWGRWVLGILLCCLMVEILLIAPRWVGSQTESTPAAAPVNTAPARDEKSASHLEQVLDGVHSLEAQGGLKEWELWAKTAMRPKAQSLWLIEQVKVHFFKNNEAAFYVDGDKGEIHEQPKDLMVHGHVVTRSASGHLFETETLYYNSSKKMLNSPTPVKMTGPKESTGDVFRLQALEMSTDLNSNTIVVRKNVKSQKTLKGGRMLLIQSDEAEFSGSHNYAKFRGNVVMDVNTMRITGPEAEFKYKPHSDDVESVAVRGGVRMSDTDRWATADSVLFELESERYIFEGSPKLVQATDELIGDKIIFSQGGKEVEIFNAKAKVDKQRVNQ